MVNFTDALNTKMGDIERPPLLPVGTYVGIVSKIPAIEKIGDGKWDVIDFQLRIASAGEDVSQDDLKEFGGLNASTVVRHRFMFSTEDEAAQKRTLFNLKRFLTEHLKVDGGDGSAVKELLNNCLNHQCTVFIGWRPDKNDPELFYAEVKKTAAVE
jgi:hypothetical protein